jgi:putative phosphoesterase
LEAGYYFPVFCFSGLMRKVNSTILFFYTNNHPFSPALTLDTTHEPKNQMHRIAPVFPVRGNMDRNPDGANLPKYEIVEIDDLSIYVLHDIDQLDLDPAAAGFAVVVSGHTHRPIIKYRDSVLYINPGSAGPRRFKLPISVGMLEIEDGHITPKIIQIEE